MIHSTYMEGIVRVSSQSYSLQGDSDALVDSGQQSNLQWRRPTLTTGCILASIVTCQTKGLPVFTWDFCLSVFIGGLSHTISVKGCFRLEGSDYSYNTTLNIHRWSVHWVQPTKSFSSFCIELFCLFLLNENDWLCWGVSIMKGALALPHLIIPQVRRQFHRQSFGWLEDWTNAKVTWRSSSRDDGEPSVMTAGQSSTQRSSAACWDSRTSCLLFVLGSMCKHIVATGFQ